MTPDSHPIKRASISELLVTLLILALIVAMLVAGTELVGLIKLPARLLAYAGGALLAYVVVGGFLIVYNCVRYLLKKG
jgi:hypothetical protein